MSKHKHTTRLITELSEINRVEGGLLCDPASREDAYEGRKSRRIKIRQELVQVLRDVEPGGALQPDQLKLKRAGRHHSGPADYELAACAGQKP